MSHSGYDYAEAQLNLQRRIDQLTKSGLYQRYDGTTALRSYRGFWRANGSSIFVVLCMYATATGTAVAAFYSSQQRKVITEAHTCQNCSVPSFNYDAIAITSSGFVT
jgi:hypothetical protein